MVKYKEVFLNYIKLQKTLKIARLPLLIKETLT